MKRQDACRQKVTNEYKTSLAQALIKSSNTNTREKALQIVVLYTTTVSDVYYSFHFISIFNPENSKQRFFYKQEFKEKKFRSEYCIILYPS